MTSPSPGFDVAYESFRAFIGSRRHYPASRPAVRGGRDEKIVVASDFHCPFHLPGAVKELIKREAADTDRLVIAGDLADMWATSRFRKSRKLSDPVRDITETQVVLQSLSDHFRQVDIIEGNHDGRPMKFLADHLPAEMMEYLALTAPGALHPLEFMAAKMPNVTVIKAKKLGQAEFGFFHQVGDLVIAHAEAYSKIPNRAVSGPVLQWLMSFALPQGLVKPFKCLVQAHTHQGGTVHGDFGVLCIENGCLCGVQEYQADAKIRSTRPPAVGWSVIHQSGGKTDLGVSRFVPLP